MTYPLVLASDLQPGTYVVLRTGSPLGLLVRWWTQSSFDHAILVTGAGEIVEATTKGVRKNPLSRYKGALAVANSAESITDLARVTIAKAGESYVGDRYGWTDLVVIALRKCGLRWKWLLRVSDDHDTMICSELVSAAGRAAGLDWLAGEPGLELVTPADLAGRRPFMANVVWD